MCGYNTKRNGVKVKILETGQEFNSIQACADYLDTDVSWVGSVTRNNSKAYTCYGYHIVRVDNPRTDIDLTKKSYMGGNAKKVEIVETGEHFNSIEECARHMNGNRSCVSAVCNNDKRTYKGFHYRTIKK